MIAIRPGTPKSSLIVENVLREAPKGSIVALVNIAFGIESIPLIRMAREYGIRILCVDRWKRSLGYIKDKAPDCYGSFTLYAGTALEAAKACKPDSLEAVIYLRGKPTTDEWEEWTLKTRSGRVYALEGFST